MAKRPDYYDGGLFRDGVARIIVLSDATGEPETHLLPVDEDHIVYGLECSCGPSWGVWRRREVIYHKSEITLVVVPDCMPERL
tara:strand:+ start:58 stop:306 length:249 start_codon:yes stop_codon:yes gene_type:complete